MRTLLLCATLVSLSPVAEAAPPAMTSKEKVLWEALRARILGVEKGLDGVLAFSVKDLKTGATLELRPQEVFPQASSIKMAILYEMFRQAEEGRLDFDELTQPKGTRVRGDGILMDLGTRLSLTWRDLAVLMVRVSDNEATNLIIDKVGFDRVNERLESLGLRNTRLRRKMMDLEAAHRGLENVSTPEEMRQLAEHVQRGTGLSPARAQDLLALAALPKTSPFRGGLPDTVRVADKPGELEAVRCVTAVVDLPNRPYVVSLMTTYLKRDTDGEAAIREISQALFETFDRLARSSELGRIISEK